MKWTVLALVVFVAGLIAFTAWRGGAEMVEEGFSTGATQGLKFLPVLVVAFILMGFVEVLLPEDFVDRWLSDASGWKGLGAAWLAGLLTPAGSVTGLPIAAVLMKAGVGAGVLVTYLTSMATLALIRIPLEIGFYGWRLMVLRVASSLILPFIAGGIARYGAQWVARGMG